MTSLNFLVVLKNLDLYYIPTKFHCCQTLNGRVNTGGFFAPPVQYRVRPDPVQNRVKKNNFSTYLLCQPMTIACSTSLVFCLPKNKSALELQRSSADLQDSFAACSWLGAV